MHNQTKFNAIHAKMSQLIIYVSNIHICNGNTCNGPNQCHQAYSRKSSYNCFHALLALELS